MTVRHIDAHRHACGPRGLQRLSRRQAIQQLQLARGPGISQPRQRLPRERVIMRGDGDPARPARQPVHHPQEAVPGVQVRGPPLGISPLSFDHTHAQSQLHRPIDVAEATAPTAGQRAAEPSAPRGRLRQQRPALVGGLGPERVEVDAAPVRSRRLEQLRDQVP